MSSRGKRRRDDPPAETFGAILAEAHKLADLAGPVTLRHFRNRLPVDNKAAGGAFDPVTRADRGAERVIVKSLKETFPDHGIVGEEFGTRRGAAPYQWVVDPIDGTRSYIIGSPLWGTLIGVLKDGQPLLGVMDQPFTGERFWSGATASFATFGGRKRRLKTRPCTRLEDAVLTSTHPNLFESEAQRRVLADLSAATRMTRYGGDCYGYCLLAAGFVDLIIESGLKSYDVVALIPIIERAGGRITTWDGGPATAGGDIIASGDARLHEAALKRIARL